MNPGPLIDAAVPTTPAELRALHGLVVAARDELSDDQFLAAARRLRDLALASSLGPEDFWSYKTPPPRLTPAELALADRDLSPQVWGQLHFPNLLLVQIGGTPWDEGWNVDGLTFESLRTVSIHGRWAESAVAGFTQVDAPVESVWANKVSGATLDALSRARWLPGVSRLSLRGARFDDAELEWPRLSELRFLDLGGAALTPDAIARLGLFQGTPALLELIANRGSCDWRAALAEGFPPNLARAEMSLDSAMVLALPTATTALRELSHVTLSVAAAEKLAVVAPGLSHLGCTSHDTESTRALAGLDGLRHLDVHVTYGEGDGLLALAPRLRSLKLRLSAPVDLPLLELLEAASSLEEFTLDMTVLTDAHVDALCRWPGVDRIQLNHLTMTPAQEERLATASWFERAVAG